MQFSLLSICVKSSIQNTIINIYVAHLMLIKNKNNNSSREIFNNKLRMAWSKKRLKEVRLSFQYIKSGRSMLF